jgi:glycosyltransferase involved in cell wall biosynthesis
MNIGFDAKRAFHNKTGLGNYSRSFIKALIDEKSDNQLYLFTPEIGDLGQEFLNKHDVKIVKPTKKIHQFLPTYWRSHGLLDEIKRDKIQIFHGLSNELPVGIERLDIKKVVTIHDLIFLRFPELYPPIDRRIYERKFKSAVVRADKIFACSQQTSTDIQEFYGIDESKIEVVYQDCGIHFRKKHSDEEKNSFLLKHQLPQKFILSVGTLEKRKNQLLLLKAFHEANLQDNSLIFLGKKADLYSDMLQYVRLNGLQNKVFFLDNIEEEELPILYQSAFAFAYISKFEGFGIPILESLRSGVPVLSSKQSSLPEVAGNAALYSDFNDAETLISNLKEISGNPELRLKLINLGYAQASKFDSDKIAKQVISNYEGLLF